MRSSASGFRIRSLTSCLLMFTWAGCGNDQPRSPGAIRDADSPAAPATSHNADTLQSGPAGVAEWHIPAKDYASTRYSGLDQITTKNVARLQPAFTFSTGVLR